MSRRRGNVETTVFATVGTTSFDDLITEVNKPLFHAALWCIGYRQLVIQFGDGVVEPKSPSFESVRDAARYSKMCVDANVKPLSIDSFRFKSDLDLEFSSSSLVISHGGAGTCLRALTPGGLRRLIVVINETLMGNHQEELAEALAEGRHAIVTTPSKLLKLLCDEPGGCKFPGKLSSSKISELLRPQVRPADAGFTSFQRGSPERLLEYLETRLKT